MFKIEGDTIHITRGNIATIEVLAKKKFSFEAGDIIRLKVVNKNDYNTVKLVKDVTVSSETTKVYIELTSEDTKIDGIINAPKTYWYEIELNPDTATQTLKGHDKEGAKEFILYPEGGEADGRN